MAMNNAERQRVQRERLKDIYNQEKRVNFIVSSAAKAALERLASCYCVTQKKYWSGPCWRLNGSCSADCFGYISKLG